MTYVNPILAAAGQGGADHPPETWNHDGITPGNRDIDALILAARELLEYSDRQDGQLAARLAAHAEGYRQGLAEAERARAEGYAEAIADVKAAQHGIVRALRGEAERQAARWHLCCLPCRRAGHRTGCDACQDRTRETFGELLEGEHLGGPLRWAS